MKTSKVSLARLILIGAGGHARVLQALASAAGLEIIGVCDPELAAKGTTVWRAIPVLGGDEALQRSTTQDVGVINGVGQTVGSHSRQAVFDRISQLGFVFPPLVHPTAWLADTVVLEAGAQVMAGAIIQPDCVIGRNSIVNTKASIDHDCRIGPHCHIAPGSTLCGGVAVGEGAFIGSGSTVLPGIEIGICATIGAGTIVSKNVGDRRNALGNPMRFTDTGQ